MMTLFTWAFWILVAVFIYKARKHHDAQRFTQEEIDAQQRKVDKLEDRALGKHPNAYVHTALKAELKHLLFMLERRADDE